MDKKMLSKRILLLLLLHCFKKSGAELDNTTTGRSTHSPPPGFNHLMVVGTVLLAKNFCGLVFTIVSALEIFVSPTASGVVSPRATRALDECSAGSIMLNKKLN